ncbi:MAG TPA: methyl-accepting chemotaxis protein, partial [Comamonadaceae bacterium]|nr:methyl-accepting chemotaxis protein [Comamonadaceae bacterium]
MNFSRITVGARLGLGFALVILAGLAVAVFGSFQLQSVQASTTLLVQDRMVKIERLNNVLDNLNIVARAVRNLAMMDDDEAREAENRRIDQARAANQTLLKQIGDGLETDEGRKIFEQLEKVRAGYNATIDKAAGLALAGQGTMASDALLRENRPLQAAYFGALRQLIELQQAAMQETAREVQGRASSAMWLMGLVAVLAAAAGAVMAWLLTRSLMRQLGGEPDYATRVAREIAQGNLAVEVNLRTGDDASLLAAMRAMRDSLAQVVTRVRQGSESVASASTQIAQGNQDLSG